MALLEGFVVKTCIAADPTPDAKVPETVIAESVDEVNVVATGTILEKAGGLDGPLEISISPADPEPKIELISKSTVSRVVLAAEPIAGAADLKVDCLASRFFIFYPYGCSFL
jgi:hypothetical protein